jgi:hypothetical protein
MRMSLSNEQKLAHNRQRIVSTQAHQIHFARILQTNFFGTS